MSNIFSNDMVLQRNIHLPVWGWAAPNEEITVKFKGQEKSTFSNSDGKWMVQMHPLTVSKKPKKMITTGQDDKKEFDNVLVGDVWLCSGQSSMEDNC